ncbi:MAG: aminotransferase class V-fold PLP-dependent enzyme, partial [Candidatus Methanomethylicia archaeon]
MLNVKEIRKDFPILEREVNGRKLIYFDNAATSQKPIQVINKIIEFYT